MTTARPVASSFVRSLIAVGAAGLLRTGVSRTTRASAPVALELQVAAPPGGRALDPLQLPPRDGNVSNIVSTSLGYFRDLEAMVESGQPLTHDSVAAVWTKYATEPSTEYAS